MIFFVGNQRIRAKVWKLGVLLADYPWTNNYRPAHHPHHLNWAILNQAVSSINTSLTTIANWHTSFPLVLQATIWTCVPPVSFAGTWFTRVICNFNLFHVVRLIQIAGPVCNIWMNAMIPIINISNGIKILHVGIRIVMIPTKHWYVVGMSRRVKSLYTQSSYLSHYHSKSCWS